MKLKPCPFCGSTDVEIETPYERVHQVGCQECDGRGMQSMDVELCIEAWNTRHVPEPEPIDITKLKEGDEVRITLLFNENVDGLIELISNNNPMEFINLSQDDLNACHTELVEE